jgi:hypothetical protein
MGLAPALLEFDVGHIVLLLVAKEIPGVSVLGFSDQSIFV